MYYDNELISKAVDLLKIADSYISAADIGDDGKSILNGCQEIYDTYEEKNKQVSALSIDKSLSDITFGTNIVPTTNDNESISDNSTSSDEVNYYDELLKELLSSGELTEEDKTIVKEYLSTGKIMAFMYFLMIKSCEIDKKNLEQEQEDFYNQTLSDFITDLPEDLKGYGEWKILEIMGSSDYKNILGEEIVAQIYAKEDEYSLNIQNINQQIVTYNQELGKAEYSLEFSKGYEPLDIPTEQVEAIEDFLTNYMDYYYKCNPGGFNFLEAFNMYCSSKDAKIDPYNLLLYLQNNPEGLAGFFATRGGASVDYPSIESPEDLINFLSEQGVFDFGMGYAENYIQFEAYKYLDPSVLVVYQNIFYTEGEEAALKFLSAYQDDINKAKGYEQALSYINDLLNNNTDFGKITDALGIGTVEGIIAYFDGWAKMLDNEGTMTVNDYRVQFFAQMLLAADSMDISEIQRQYDAGEITESEYESQMSLAKWAKESDDVKTWCNRFYNAGMSVGQQIPSLCISYLTMGIGSSVGLAGQSLVKASKVAYSVSMFGSQFGSEKNNALRKGSSLTTAYLYGLLKAGSEVAVENLFQIPGIPEEGLIKIAITDSTPIKMLKYIGANFIERPGGEIVEELIQNVIEGEIEYGFYSEEYTFKDWYNSLGETGITTYISTLILGANGLITDASKLKGVEIAFKDGSQIKLKPDQIRDMIQKNIIQIQEDGNIKINDNNAVLSEILRFNPNLIIKEVTDTNNNSEQNSNIQNKLVEIIQKVDSILGFGKGLQTINEYIKTGDMSKLISMGIKQITDLNFDKLTAFMKESKLLSEIQELAIANNLFQNVSNNGFSVNANNTSLSVQEKAMVEQITNDVMSGKLTTLVINSSSEISSSVLSALSLEVADKLNICLLDGLGDGKGKLKGKYAVSEIHTDRVSYSVSEMISILSAIETITSKVDTSLTLIEQAKQAFSLINQNIPVSLDGLYKITASLRGITSQNANGQVGLVCAGFASLFNEVCNRLGIECEYVKGVGLVDGKEQSHVWNIITIDGVDIPVDSCWGEFGANSDFFLNHIPDNDEVKGFAAALEFVRNAVASESYKNNITTALKAMLAAIKQDNPMYITNSNIKARDVFTKIPSYITVSFVYNNMLEIVYDTMVKYCGNTNKALDTLSAAINNPALIPSTNSAHELFRNVPYKAVNEFIQSKLSELTQNAKETLNKATETVVDNVNKNNSEVESNDSNIGEIKEKVETIEPAKEQVENNTPANPPQNKKSIAEMMKSLGSYLDRGHLVMNMLLKQSTSGEDSFHTANTGRYYRNFTNYVKDGTEYHKTLSDIINIFSLMVTKGETKLSLKGYGRKLYRSTNMEEVLGGGLMGFISTATEPLSVTSIGVKDKAKVQLILNVADNVVGIVPSLISEVQEHVKAGENEVLLAPFCNIEYGSTNPDGTINATITPGVLEKTNVGLDQVEAEQENFAKTLDDHNRLSENLYNALGSLKDCIASGNIPNIVKDIVDIFKLQKELNDVNNAILGYKETVKKYLMNQFIAIQEEAGKIIIPYVDNTSQSSNNNNQSSDLSIEGLFKKYFYESSKDSSVSYKSLQSIFETFNEKMQSIRNLYDKIIKDEASSDKKAKFKEWNSDTTIESDGDSVNINRDENSVLTKLFGEDFWFTIEKAQGKDAITFFKTFNEAFSQFKEKLIKETIARNADVAFINEDGIKLKEDGRWYTIPKYMLDQVEGKTANEILYDILLHQKDNFSGVREKFKNLYEIKLEQTSNGNYTLTIKGKTYSLNQNVMDVLRLETVSGTDGQVLNLARTNPDKILGIIESSSSQMTPIEATILGNILGKNWQDKIDGLQPEKLNKLKDTLASYVEKVKHLESSVIAKIQTDVIDIVEEPESITYEEEKPESITYEEEKPESITYEEKFIPANLRTHITDLLMDEGMSKSRINLWLDSLPQEQIESLARQYNHFSEILDTKTGAFGSDKYFDHISAEVQQKKFDAQIKKSIFEFNPSLEFNPSSEVNPTNSETPNDSYIEYL